MPIPRDQFDQGLDETSYKVIEFLKSRSKEAFEPNEIAEGVFGLPTPSKQPGATSAELAAKAKRMEFFVADLLQKGLIDKKSIGDKTYYCIHLD